MKRNGIFGVLLGASALVAAVWLSSAAPARQPSVPAPPSVDYPIPHIPAKPAPAKEQGVEELIEQLVALKAKEAEVTAQLKAKLEKQRGGIEKLRKLGVVIDAVPEMKKAPTARQEKAFKDAFAPEPK